MGGHGGRITIGWLHRSFRVSFRYLSSAVLSRVPFVPNQFLERGTWSTRKPFSKYCHFLSCTCLPSVRYVLRPSKQVPHICRNAGDDDVRGFSRERYVLEVVGWLFVWSTNFCRSYLHRVPPYSNRYWNTVRPKKEASYSGRNGLARPRATYRFRGDFLSGDAPLELVPECRRSSAGCLGLAVSAVPESNSSASARKMRLRD